MPPLQQQPQQPTNNVVPPVPTQANSVPPTPPLPTPEKKSHAFVYIVIVLVLLALLTAGAMYFFNPTGIEDPSLTQTTPTPTPTPTPDALTQMERENDAQNFSDIDTDFGAEVNAAAQ